MVRSRILIALGVLALATTVGSAQATGRLSGEVTVQEGKVPEGLTIQLMPRDDSLRPVELKVNKKGKFLHSRLPTGAYTAIIDGYAITWLQFVGRSPEGQKFAEFEEEIPVGEAIPPFQMVPGLRATVNLRLVEIDTQITGGLSIEEVKDNSPKLLALNTLFEQQDWEGLIAEAEPLLAEDPELGGGQYLYAIALWRQQRYGEADAAMGKAIERSPDQPAIFETYGALLVEQGQALAAEGDATAAAGSFTRALDLLARGLEDDPGSINALTNRVIALDALGRADETLAALEALLAEDPGQVRAYLHKAQLLTDAGRPEDALAVFDDIPSDDPSIADEIYNTAVEFYNQEKNEAAIGAVNRALEINSELPLLYRLKGRILIQMGSDEEGIASLRRYLSMVPEDDPEAGPDRALVEALGGGGD